MCLNWLKRNKMLWVSRASITHRWGFDDAGELSLRGLFSGKAEKMSAELEHAEQVMLLHEKQHFAVDKLQKHLKHHQKEKENVAIDAGPEKYSSLYSSFDELKPLGEDLPPGVHKVPSSHVDVDNLSVKQNYCLITAMTNSLL